MISFVIPVFNEEKILASSLKNTLEVIHNINYELILVDDGSIDKSLEIIKSYVSKDKRVKVISSNKNMGRGCALAKGFDVAKGDIILYFDADITLTKDYIDRFIKELYCHDLVIGSKTEAKRHGTISFARRFLSNTYNFFARKLINRDIKDFQCGAKGIRKTKYLKICNLMNEQGWSWDTEMIMYANLNNLKIKEIPLELFFLSRKSKVKIVSDSFFMGVTLTKLWLKKINYLNIRSYFNNKSKKYCEDRYRGIKKIFGNETDVLINIVDPHKNEAILDVGCGDGYYSGLIKKYGAKAYGIDVSENMIKKLKKSGIPGKVTDMESFNLKRKFDKAIISGSLEFCFNPLECIKNVRKHLKKNGKIVILLPYLSFTGILYVIYYLCKGISIKVFTKKKIMQILKDSHFKNTKIKRANSLTMIASGEC